MARKTFTERGGIATLDEIARNAGLGIGTLYRHFPTRDALVEEIYRDAIAQLVAAAHEYAAARPPAEALRAWMLLFVDYLAAKRLLAEPLKAIAGGTTALFASTAAQLDAAVTMLATAAVADGSIRLTVQPLDLLRAVASVAQTDDNLANARAMVDVLMAGVRRESARA